MPESVETVANPDPILTPVHLPVQKQTIGEKRPLECGRGDLQRTNETKQNETKRNETKRNETKRNKTKQNETKRNKTKRNEMNDLQ